MREGLRTSRPLRAVAAVILFGGLACGAVGVAAWGIGSGLVADGGLFRHRFIGTVNAMTNGILMLMAFLVALGFVVRGGGGRRRRALLIAVAAVLGLAVLLTQTRSALMGVVAGVGAMVLLARPRRFLVFAAVVAVLTGAVYGSGGRIVPDRL